MTFPRLHRSHDCQVLGNFFSAVWAKSLGFSRWWHSGNRRTQTRKAYHGFLLSHNWDKTNQTGDIETDCGSWQRMARVLSEKRMPQNPVHLRFSSIFGWCIHLQSINDFKWTILRVTCSHKCYLVFNEAQRIEFREFEGKWWKATGISWNSWTAHGFLQGPGIQWRIQSGCPQGF